MLQRVACVCKEELMTIPLIVPSADIAVRVKRSVGLFGITSRWWSQSSFHSIKFAQLSIRVALRGFGVCVVVGNRVSISETVFGVEVMMLQYSSHQSDFQTSQGFEAWAGHVCGTKI